ncbi:MAG: hypothetical protein ACKOYJ_11300 [Planctomycetia bacterium]
MDRVSGFQELLQGLSPVTTAPSFVSFCTIVSGWLFSGRGIITRMIVAAGSWATKHFSSYHRLVSTASWSLDAMGLAVFTMIEPFLGDVVVLGVILDFPSSHRSRASRPTQVTGGGTPDLRDG